MDSARAIWKRCRIDSIVPSKYVRSSVLGYPTARRHHYTKHLISLITRLSYIQRNVSVLTLPCPIISRVSVKRDPYPSFYHLLPHWARTCSRNTTSSPGWEGGGAGVFGRDGICTPRRLRAERRQCSRPPASSRMRPSSPSQRSGGGPGGYSAGQHPRRLSGRWRGVSGGARWIGDGRGGDGRRLDLGLIG